MEFLYSLYQWKRKKKYTSYDVADTGPAVVTAFNHPNDWNGKLISFAGEHSYLTEYVEIFSKVTGKKARYNFIPVDVWEKLPFPGAKEIAHMFGFFNEFSYHGGADITTGKKANPKLKSFEEWLKVAGWKGE